MLSETIIKEELNIAYMHALSTSLKFSVTPERVDTDSIDLNVQGRADIFNNNSSAHIKFQLKATSSPRYSKDKTQLIFDLPVKNYDDLRRSQEYIPRYLAVMILPSSEKDWVKLDFDSLILKGTIYWLDLKGLGETKNKRKIRLKIPVNNILNESSLFDIMEKASKWEHLYE